MKNIILIALILMVSHAVFSQELIIHKTDQTSVNFNLSEVDSITFSVTPALQSLDLLNWECITTESAIEKLIPATGVFEKTDEGLKIFGSNNEVTKAIHPVSITNSSLTNKSIYLKWKVNGNGSFQVVTANLIADTTNWSSAGQMLNLTTNYSVTDSKVISGNIWYFTRIIVTPNSAKSVTATENYDNLGGTVIQEISINLDQPVTTFLFGTKAKKESCVILGEARVE